MLKPQLETLADQYDKSQLAFEKKLPDGRLAAVIVRGYNTIIIVDIGSHTYEDQW